MAGIEAQALGRWRHVCFRAAQIDVVSANVDLLILGMSEQAVTAGTRGGANQLDQVLHGTLGRLRAGGIFGGVFDETLMLSKPPAPIRARAVMLIGVGRQLSGDPAPFSALTQRAMRAALRMQARHVACMLGWSDLEIPAAAIAPMAAGMMQGALMAIDAFIPAPAGDAAALPGIDWTFDIRNGDAEQTSTTLRQTLLAWR